MTQGWVQRSLIWSNNLAEQKPLALQLRERRTQRGVPRGPKRSEPAINGWAIEWKAALANYARAWMRFGGKATVRWARDGSPETADLQGTVEWKEG